MKKQDKKTKSKPKNFKKAMVSTLRYTKKYNFLLIIAIVLAICSSIFTLLGPNKISDITSIINKGVSYSYVLSDTEMSELETNGETSLDIDLTNYKNLEMDYEGTKINVSIEGFVLKTDGVDALTFTLLCKIGEYDRSFDYVVGITDLNNEKVLNFEDSNFGISLENEVYSIWFNTSTKIDLQEVVKIGTFLIVIYALSLLCGYIQNYVMAVVTAKVGLKMRDDISKKINKLPFKYLDATQKGDILSRVTNDVDTVATSLSNSAGTLVGAIVLLLGSLFMMFYTQPIMALSAIGASVIGFVLLAVIMKNSQKYYDEQQQDLGDLNGHIEEVYTGHNVIRAYNASNKFKKEFNNINKKLYTSGWKSQFMGGLMPPLMGFIGNFGYVVVCIVGAIMASNGTIGFGVIVAFMIYIRLFTQPFSQIAQALARLQSAAAASERVFEILDEKEIANEDNLTGKVENVKGNVEFDHVSFGYDKDKTIIKDFSASIKAGQKVAIVGPTGAGKTTLVNLLMKFYDIDSGDIRIDGVSIKDIKREDIHNMFGMVLQDTWLFEASVIDNLKYNNENVTYDQIKEACKVCGIHHFIKTLPNGYDTILDDNTSISAGQKQLLTIARAMIQNSPMLILDEATSSVDTRTELLIQNAMDTLTKNRTSFVIAHRLSTIKNADLILVLRDGDIVEKGTHEELLKLNGFYSELYKSQFEEE